MHKFTQENATREVNNGPSSSTIYHLAHPAPNSRTTDLIIDCLPSPALPRVQSVPRDLGEHAMNGTPRMRSSYPSTPGSAKPSPKTTQDSSKVRSPLPNLPDSSSASASSTSPVIPVTLIDAPSQRMYTFVVYSLLLGWRIYDWWQLVEEDTTSIGLFLKWAVIDLMFLFGVPLLRIPWLEWSETTSLVACCVHVVLDGMLMFRIPVSL